MDTDRLIVCLGTEQEVNWANVTQKSPIVCLSSLRPAWNKFTLHHNNANSPQKPLGSNGTSMGQKFQQVASSVRCEQSSKRSFGSITLLVPPTLVESKDTQKADTQQTCCQNWQNLSLDHLINGTTVVTVSTQETSKVRCNQSCKNTGTSVQSSHRCWTYLENDLMNMCSRSPIPGSITLTLWS